MKATKKLIERNLKFTNQYVYLGINRGSVEAAQFTCCDNCGKLITNMVKVADKNTKQLYTIGVDCAETLSKAKCLYNNGSQTDFYLDLYAFNQTKRFATELNKGKVYVDSGFLLSVKNDKGIELTVFKNQLQEFYPELVK